MLRQSLTLSVVAVALMACGTPSDTVRRAHKEKLVLAIRQRILESVEAEKSAVLATSDEEAQALALAAQRAEGDIDRLRGELRQLISEDRRPDEDEKLDAFDTAWAGFKDVDKRLLALAVANSDQKATRFAAQDGAAAVDRFVDAVTAALQDSDDPAEMHQLAAAPVAALRLQALLLLHTTKADASSLPILEQRIQEQREAVDRALATAQDPGHAAPEQLAAAVRAWADYQRIIAEVLPLSRGNTDTMACDMSVHEKRRVTQDCLAALSALMAVIESEAPATR